MGIWQNRGELLKLGFTASRTAIHNVLERHNIEPAPVFNGSIGWRHLVAHYNDQILACAFFAVETIWLKTIYVLFFIELGTRRVRMAGCTTKPNTIWVTQQARQLVWELQDESQDMAFLIHDNDKKFSSSFDAVFDSTGIEIVSTPYQAPQANAYAERWVRSIREECLDHILIVNKRHLFRVLREYIEYYNQARPHQGIGQRFPVSAPQRSTKGTIRRRNVLGGIIHDYYRQSSTPASGCG